MPDISYPPTDALLSHFRWIGDYLYDQQINFMDRIGFFSEGNRSRLNSMRRNVLNEVDAVAAHGEQWSNNHLPLLFTQGWTLGTGGKVASAISKDAQAELNALSGEFNQRMGQMRSYLSSSLNTFTTRTRNAGLQGVVDAGGSNSWFRKNGVRAVQYVDGRQYPLEAYGKMLTQAAESRAYNFGVLQGALAAGTKFVEVSDGPECGWTAHTDPDLANGKIVGVEEALSYPIAHPACRRLFLPRPDIKGKKDEEPFSAAQKAAVFAGAALLSGVVARGLFTVETSIVDAEAARLYANVASIDSFFRRRFNQLTDYFTPTGNEAEILPFYHDLPTPPPLSLPRAVGDVERAAFETNGYQFSASTNIADWKWSVQQWGNAFMDERRGIEVPDWVRNSIDATNKDSRDQVVKKFLNFGKWANGTDIRQRTTDQGATILNFVQKRRAWNEFAVLRNSDMWKSGANFVWTSYGPRTRIDLTDFLRGHITLTKDGIRRSISLNPAGNLRSVLAMSPDGTLMGALRYVPNHFLRAAVETDEFGKLTGNIRFVPKDWPFRARLEFETPRPRVWERQGLVPGRDYVDLRSTAAGLELKKTRGFGLDDFSFRDVYDTFKQLRPKAVVFEVNIFRQSIAELNSELRIPFPRIRETIDYLKSIGQLKEEKGLFTGWFSYRPTKEQVKDLFDIFKDQNVRLFGNIRFSALNGKYSSLLPDVRSSLNTRKLVSFGSGVEFKSETPGLKFQEARWKEFVTESLTSVRISGLDVVKNMTNLELARVFDVPIQLYNDFVDIMRDVDSRIWLFIDRYSDKLSRPVRYRWMASEIMDILVREGMEALGLVNVRSYTTALVEAIRGFSEQQVVDLAEFRKRNPNVRALIKGGPTHQGYLIKLLRITSEDTWPVIELKLRDFVEMLRASSLDYDEVRQILGTIDDDTIHLAAKSLWDKVKGSRVLF